MYFPTSQHYSFNELNMLSQNCKSGLPYNNKDEDKCIICLEDIDIQTIHKLEDNKFLYKKCSCNPIIHHECFIEWYSQKFKCPICMFHIEICEPFHKRCIIYSFRMGYYVGCLTIKITFISINLLFSWVAFMLVTQIINYYM